MYLGVHESIRYSCQILIKLQFFRQISRKHSNKIFTTIHPVGAESFHANGRTDGQTEMTKLVVAFHNFANSPNVKYDLRM